MAVQWRYLFRFLAFEAAFAGVIVAIILVFELSWLWYVALAAWLTIFHWLWQSWRERCRGRG